MPEPGQKLYYSVGTTGGLRGRKRSLYMGGVNVPFIVRWPGHVPAGRVDKTSVLAGVDMLPTLLAATGMSAPAGYQSDGLNVSPPSKAQPFTREAPVFWEWRGPHSQPADWPTHAIRDGEDRVVIFKRWDKNADGQLSLDEYTGGLAKKEDAPRRFKSFDLNGDGKISMDEFAPAR
jgi:arylsulfatase A-like enzyme